MATSVTSEATSTASGFPASGFPASGPGRHRPGEPGVDERVAAYRASARARDAVSRHGDPGCAWSVLLSVRLAAPVSPAGITARLAEECHRRPELGAPPVVSRAPSADLLHQSFATTPYAPKEPLVRVAVGNRQANLLIAAHHGAVDAAGLIELLGVALGRPDAGRPAYDEVNRFGEPPARPSVGTVARQVGEALLAPPDRLHRAPSAAEAVPAGGAGETLLQAVLPRQAIGTSAAVAAAAGVAAAWNAEHGAGRRRIVAGVEVCRRDGERRRASFLRLPVPAGADRRTVRLLMAAQAAEPPLQPGGPAWLAARLTAGRLGTTVSVSHLGTLGAAGILSAAYFPVVSGPAGLAFGVVSTERTTTVTVRARRRDFSTSALSALLDAFTAVLPAPRPVAGASTDAPAADREDARR